MRTASLLLRAARSAAAAGVGAVALAGAGTFAAAQSARPAGTSSSLTQQRTFSYDLDDHNHGKARVRVLKVRRNSATHSVSEYTVQTRLFSPDYAKVFTDEDNTDLVATDTQKNTVYIVAKRTAARTPEEMGIALAKHFMTEYPVLSAIEVHVSETAWRRVVTDGPHDHSFERGSDERAVATVRMSRDALDAPDVESRIESMVVLKTTQSGFEGYLRDRYTLLPETRERCLATELSASWRYTRQQGAAPLDYGAVRQAVRRELQRGLFGPSRGGVYSASLQATIYDAGCLVLSAVPDVARIAIDTPNLHYLPFHTLKQVGEQFEDDVFIPTSEPSGIIHCCVSRPA